jgi:hypothetical protein
MRGSAQEITTEMIPAKSTMNVNITELTFEKNPTNFHICNSEQIK